MNDARGGGLLKLADAAVKAGAEGMLVSGGMVKSGAVPFRRVAEDLKNVSSKLKVFAHTGVISRDDASILAECGVRLGMVDVVGHRDTIREILGQPFEPEDYVASLRYMKEYGVKAAPHIIVGLHHGELKGEFAALEMLKSIDIDALIVVGFMPLQGTSMEQVLPPSVEDVMKVLEESRRAFPDKPLILGCARARDSESRRLDELAVRAGVDAIAFPTLEAYKLARKLGRPVEKRWRCCSDLVFETMNMQASSSVDVLEVNLGSIDGGGLHVR
jgi:uncharacterized radical SAM superfamily protein